MCCVQIVYILLCALYSQGVYSTVLSRMWIFLRVMLTMHVTWCCVTIYACCSAHICCTHGVCYCNTLTCITVNRLVGLVVKASTEDPGFESHLR